MSAAAAGTVVAFDYGRKRIGIAVGQALTRTATALVTVDVRRGRPDWPAIAQVIETWDPQQLVLGMPSTTKGAAHALQAPIERFARQLNGRFGLEVAFVDERLSSYAASADPESKRVGLDAVAARYMLETWLNLTSPTG